MKSARSLNPAATYFRGRALTNDLKHDEDKQIWVRCETDRWKHLRLSCAGVLVSVPRIGANVSE